eukprot:TRINITY_DN1102_c0_g1_i12.p1 TRINITY_DN1102_c0_g1~~TRINITY_DN1102_c0_g1_i12.p1  ORF type:complete len:140 (-),score=30.56 TRINITY_DN1102_c0_g1_i12:37-456(-)
MRILLVLFMVALAFATVSATGTRHLLQGGGIQEQIDRIIARAFPDGFPVGTTGGDDDDDDDDDDDTGIATFDFDDFSLGGDIGSFVRSVVDSDPSIRSLFRGNGGVGNSIFTRFLEDFLSGGDDEDEDEDEDSTDGNYD